MKLTPQEINEKIAELKGWIWVKGLDSGTRFRRWLMPLAELEGNATYWEKNGVAQCGEDVEKDPAPIYTLPNWATDDGQACKLLDEMPWYDLRRLATCADGVRYRVSWYENTIITKYGPAAKTRPLAICAAWLAYNGIEDVEIVEEP